MTEAIASSPITMEQALAGSPNVAAFAEALVREHHVDATPSDIDEWSGGVSRLSDADVDFDATEKQRVALERAR